MASGVMATLAPAPASPGEIEGKCPPVSFDVRSLEGISDETGTIDSLGAFVLGVLDRRCHEGKARTEISGRQITYRFLSDASYAGIVSRYEVSLTGQLDNKRTVSPDSITSMKIEEDISVGSKGGTAASVEAQAVGDGWILSVVEPHDNAEPIVFSGNTEGSIAARRASDIALLAQGVIDDALGPDWIGDRRQGASPLPGTVST